MNKKDFNERSLIDFEVYIKNYVPRGWTESISNVTSVPHFTNEEFSTLIKSKKEGKLDSYIMKYEWYTRQAIKSFFSRIKL